MPRRSTKKERGVFEKDPGSEIWWIRYYIDGRERREKVGRKKDASDLYKIRKADALRGVKLPTNMKSKGVKFEALGKHGPNNCSVGLCNRLEFHRPPSSTRARR